MSAEESTGAPATTATLPPGGPHFLESEWVIWEHRSPDKNSKSYEDNMEKLCDISTVEDFWRAWNNIPKPSAVFFDGRTRKRFANRQVESFSLFKKNIKPEWEDPQNRSGAEWFCRKTFTSQQLVRKHEIHFAERHHDSLSLSLCIRQLLLSHANLLGLLLDTHTG